MFIVSLAGIGFSYYWYQMKQMDNSAFLTLLAIGIIAIIQSMIIWKYSKFKNQITEYEYKHKDLHMDLIDSKQRVLPHLSVARPISKMPLSFNDMGEKNGQGNDKENTRI